MTDDLQAQQQALRAAGEEAESRRNFIETVLSRVSAGVIGVDADRKVSAANQQALSLLQLDGGQARGRPVEEIAPEFATVLARACATGPRRRGRARSRARRRDAAAAPEGQRRGRRRDWC
jgi:two-component system nitrogen regulation sensor histidine kinase NtrY